MTVLFCIQIQRQHSGETAGGSQRSEEATRGLGGALRLMHPLRRDRRRTQLVFCLMQYGVQVLAPAVHWMKKTSGRFAHSASMNEPELGGGVRLTVEPPVTVRYSNPTLHAKAIIRRMEQEEIGMTASKAVEATQESISGAAGVSSLGTEARELNRLIGGVSRKLEAVKEDADYDPETLVLTAQSHCAWSRVHSRLETSHGGPSAAQSRRKGIAGDVADTRAFRWRRAVTAFEIYGMRCMFSTALEYNEELEQKGLTRFLMERMLGRFLGPSKRIAKNIACVQAGPRVPARSGMCEPISTTWSDAAPQEALLQLLLRRSQARPGSLPRLCLRPVSLCEGQDGRPLER